MTGTEPAASPLALQPIDVHLVDPDVATRVVPPPADALDDRQREELRTHEPLSLLHVLGVEGDDGAEAGNLAGQRLRELVAAGRYHHCGPVFAVHRLRTPDHQQTGLVVGLPLAAVVEGRVRAHEQTRSDRERNLADFLDAAAMDVSPVVLTHPEVPGLAEVLDEVTSTVPELVFTGWHDLQHEVWVVRDVPTQERIEQLTGQLEAVTIVDGHHRVAAARASAEGDRDRAPRTLLAELVAEPELRLIGFDRQVALRDPEELDRLLAGLPDIADVTPLDGVPSSRPEGEHEILLGSARGWWRIELRDPPTQLPDALPAAQLQDRILAPYLEITDPRTDPRLADVPALETLEHEASRLSGEEPTLLFVPRAVTAKELLAVAEAGEMLPPKSTYADPKPGPGVFVRLRDELPSDP